MNHALSSKAIEQFRQVDMHINELRVEVESIYGMYHDSLHGWLDLAKTYEKFIQQQIAQGMSRDQAMSCRVLRGAGQPDNNGILLHQSTLGERLAACQNGGRNEIALSNLCIVSIYSLWEDGTRVKIARTLKIEKNQVKSNLFGDIGKMRNAILHAGGIMDERANSMKMLQWFQPGERVLMSKEKMHQIIESIRKIHEEIAPEGFKPQTIAANDKNSTQASEKKII